MKNLGYLLLLLLPVFAFNKNKKPQTSKFLTKHYVKVPAGKLYTNVKGDHIKIAGVKPMDLDALGRQDFIRGLDSCSAFFISSTEVTNNNWREFLMYLKQGGRTEEYNANVLDTSVWRNRLVYTEPFAEYYYQHPTYAEYPAVGMSLKQATAYANWLTEIFALRNQDAKVTFSIPTKKQWIRAARGESASVYPWAGPYLRNSKGQHLANFNGLEAQNIHYDEESNDYVVVGLDDKNAQDLITITAPARSYWPNEFGVYNMSGNIAELVSDDTVAMGGSWNDTGYDVRLESEQPATKAKATIGFRVVAIFEK